MSSQQTVSVLIKQTCYYKHMRRVKRQIKLVTIIAALSLMTGILVIPQDVSAASVTSLSTTTIEPSITVLTITGSGFGTYDSTADQVCFNSIVDGSAIPYFCSSYGTSDITSWNNTTIILKAPADPNSLIVGGRIHVNIDGVMIDGPFYNLQPVITAVDATSLVAGTTLKLTGKYFQNAIGQPGYYHLRVYFNGVVGGVYDDGWTATTFTAAVPDAATTGPVSIALTLDSDSSVNVTATGPTINILTPFTNDTYSAFQQYLKQTNIDQAWSRVVGKNGPIVAVIDEGVYINHPDLLHHIWVNAKERIGNRKDDDQNGYVDDIYGWDYVKGSGEMTVYGTHGTLVAGIIGAVKNNSEGISGVNPNVKIMPLRVCSSKGCPVDYTVKAIYYAVDNGATVINLSLGSQGTTGYTTGYNKAIKYAYDHGVIIVAAAGNGDLESGRGEDLNIVPESPICNDLGKNAVIGVGAVDDQNYLTAWSNFGAQCVDAYAPGVNIISTAVPKYSNLGGYYDNTESGTSFAAPIVTGIVSLLRQQYPYMPNSEVVKRIRAAANTSGVIDANQLLLTVATYKPARITGLVPNNATTAKLTGARTVTINGKGFSKKTAIAIGMTNVTVKFISKTKVTATFSLKSLGYGKHLLTVTGDNKQRSIYRWFEIKK